MTSAWACAASAAAETAEITGGRRRLRLLLRQGWGSAVEGFLGADTSPSLGVGSAAERELSTGAGRRQVVEAAACEGGFSTAWLTCTWWASSSYAFYIVFSDHLCEVLPPAPFVGPTLRAPCRILEICLKDQSCLGDHRSAVAVRRSRSGSRAQGRGRARSNARGDA